MLGVPGPLGTDDGARVVVHAHEIHRRANGLHVACLHLRCVGTQIGQHVGGIVSLEQRIHVPAQQFAVFELGMDTVCLGIRGALYRREIEHDAESGLAALLPEGLKRQPMAQQKVVGRLRSGGATFDAWRKDTLVITQHRHDPRLIVGRDGSHTIAHAPVYALRILHKPVHGIPVCPASGRLQLAGQVPVVQGEIGLDAAVQQTIDDALIKIESFLVPVARATRAHARPGNRKTVGIHTQTGDQVQIGFPAVVMVTGHHTVAGVGDGTWLAAKVVPDGRALAVQICRALDLECAGSDPPDKARRERSDGGGRKIFGH